MTKQLCSTVCIYIYIYDSFPVSLATQQLNLTGTPGSPTTPMDLRARQELEHIKVSYAMSVTFAVGVMQVRGRSAPCGAVDACVTSFRSCTDCA